MLPFGVRTFLWREILASDRLPLGAKNTIEREGVQRLAARYRARFRLSRIHRSISLPNRTRPRSRSRTRFSSAMVRQSGESHDAAVRCSPFTAPSIDICVSPGSRQRCCPVWRILNFRMKLVKYVLLFRSDFPGFSGEIVEKSLLRGVGKLI
jgi:hypothetical protein